MAHHADPPEEPQYNQDLFALEISEAEERIAGAALNDYGSVEFAVMKGRPLIRESALRAHGNPSEATDPIRYYEALQTSEETLRRSIVRGLGHLQIKPLLEHTFDIMDNGLALEGTGEASFAPDIARGRVHQGERGRFVSLTDKVLRSVNDAALDEIGSARLRGNIEPTFIDTTLRVRRHCERILDLKFGDAWRDLDPALVTSMKVKELQGKKLSKHDRRLLLGPSKLLNIYQAVGNAVVAAAEFTAIGLEHMQKALISNDVPSEEWYPYAFSNLSKLGFAAKLPFWAAQDIGIRANDPNSPLMFAAQHLQDGTQKITFTDPAYQKYYDKDIIAACQGVVPPLPRYLRQGITRTMSHFVDRLELLSKVGETQLPHDWTDIKSFKAVTSSDAATALALSIAYRGQYDLTETMER